jgi:predicted short-subunit dehydrogenase-like oxidoreductase (DUF2520 family)
LYDAGYKIELVVTRGEKSGKALTESVKANWKPEPLFPDSTEVIIVAVPDHSLEQVLKNMKISANTVVAHTAGSYGLDIFPSHISKKGVFYPLQTFSEGRSINLEQVPFLLEAGDEITANILSGIASTLSGNVKFVDAEQRRKLHLAAVFMCNFTNHMFTAGNKVLTQAGFSLDIMQQLINETISKAVESGPSNSQTGPAFRNDWNTIEKHLSMLSSDPVIHDLYKAVTQSIIDFYKNKNRD